MNRHVKFRGWCGFRNCWVHGDLLRDNSGEPLICVPKIILPCPVHSHTVGQSIGLTTTCTKRIELFEQDIIRFDNTEIGGQVYIGEIIWCDDQALGNLAWGLWTQHGYLQTDFLGSIELLGNSVENKLEDFTE